MDKNTDIFLLSVVKSYLVLADSLGFLGSCISLYYIIVKLKVSAHVKRALLAEGFFILIGSILGGLGVFLTAWNDSNNSVSCGLLIDWIPINCTTIGGSSLILGSIRFYMADRTGRSKRVHHTKITNLTMLAILMYSLYVIGMLLSGLLGGNHVSPLANICSGRDTNGIPAKLNSLIILITAVLSIYFDIKLVCFIRQQNQVQPVRMVAWSVVPPKSSSRNLDDELKDTVPIISTMISGSFFVIGVIAIFAVHMLVSVSTFYSSQWLLVVGSTVLYLHLPLVLILTVKSQDKKKPARLMPPQGLQYHDPERRNESC